MTNYRPGYSIARVIVLAICVAAVLSLFGCAISDEERIDFNQITDDFYTFVDECEFAEGSLYIPRRRVPNGTPTPWEMQDSVCYLDGRSIEMTEW